MFHPGVGLGGPSLLRAHEAAGPTLGTDLVGVGVCFVIKVAVTIRTGCQNLLEPLVAASPAKATPAEASEKKE